MKFDDRILVLGARGMVGSAIVRLLQSEGYTNVDEAADVDLRDAKACREIFGLGLDNIPKPAYVFHCAGKVGGIIANSTYPADFIYDNLQMALNVMECAYVADVVKLLNLGSSCIYPRLADQPIREEALMTGPLEETNRAYAMAKITAIELCRAYRTQHGCNFISAMPTNLYGPGDNFDLQQAHVIPALIRKFWGATGKVFLGGDGSPLREFLHVDDLARACLVLMDRYDEPQPINVGYGEDISIRDLALAIAEEVGFKGEIVWDTTIPNGTPRKLLDSSKVRSLGWAPEISLEEGLRSTANWVRDRMLAEQDIRGWSAE